MTSKRKLVFRVVLGAMAVATAAWAANPSTRSEVAGPRIIMFHSGVLGEERVYLTDVYENLQFMLAIGSPADTVPPDFKGGPFVDIVMYWHNPTWEPHARDSVLLRSLSPEQGQRSRLYLARPGLRSFVDFPVYIKYRGVDSSGIEILKRHRIPVTAGE